MSFLRARWVLPVAGPPIDGGWIEIADGRVTGVGAGRPPAGPIEDLGDVAILPALVNAHTHLELSWMAGRVPRASSMADWIRALLRLRRSGSPGPDEELRAAREAAASVRAGGTALIGDISNQLTTPAVLAAAGLGGVVFHELIGFAAPDPAGVVNDAWARISRTAEPWNRGTSEPRNHGTSEPSPALSFSVVAHAPYSVSPALFREIAKRAGPAPLAVHLGESLEEMEFLQTGGGPMRALLEDLGAWTDEWRPPGCDPVGTFQRVGYLRPGTLVVHGVHLSDRAFGALRDAQAVLVTCPRSNAWVGSGPPPLSRAYRAGVRIAVGTDSLASSPSLDLFDELAAMRRAAPDVAASRLLASATAVGAEALGFGAQFGTIEPGKRAAFAGLQVPAGTTDVEEYVVSGAPFTHSPIHPFD